VTAKIKRRLMIVCLALGVALTGIAATIHATWPNNFAGVFVNERRNREANIRALEWRITKETDPAGRAFYQAWLAEEKGDLKDAIQGFRSLRDAAPPGTGLHLTSSLRLGLAYGRNGQPDEELAVYQGLMGRYPGPSRLSQATYHLRRGERDQARRLLDDALARDERDGSLGSERKFVLGLRAGLGPAPHDGPSGSR
jgi:tetratricopeptide (TPR) repeat protein